MADTFVNFTGAGTLYNDLRRRAARAGGNLAPEFSTTSTYAVGDFCIYKDALYRCTTAITTPGAWSSSKWTAVKTMSEVKTLKTDKLDSIDVAAVFSESQTYNVGEYVTHNNHLFRCKTAITTAGAWDSTKWTSVKAMSEVKRLKDGKAEQSDLEALSSDVTNLSNTKVTRTELAATFSTAQTYDVGDYVTYNNALYRCTTAITTPGAWSSSKWVAVVAMDDVADIKEEVVETSRDVADIQEDVSDLKSAINSAASEASGQEMLAELIAETGLTDTALAVIGLTFGALPSDETAGDIRDAIALEADRLSAIFDLWLAEKESA